MDIDTERVGKRAIILDKKQIGKKLMELRGQKSRDEVAIDLNISYSALQMYENGERVPRDEIKLKIAKYYKVSVQSIFFDEQRHQMCS